MKEEIRRVDRIMPILEDVETVQAALRSASLFIMKANQYFILSIFPPALHQHRFATALGRHSEPLFLRGRRGFRQESFLLLLVVPHVGSMFDLCFPGG